MSIFLLSMYLDSRFLVVIRGHPPVQSLSQKESDFMAKSEDEPTLIVAVNLVRTRV